MERREWEVKVIERTRAGKRIEIWEKNNPFPIATVETLENAHLIAAAPELLDCIKEAEEQSRKRRPLKKETWLKMCELILKAENK